jgi:hypothetical protein
MLQENLRVAGGSGSPKDIVTPHPTFCWNIAHRACNMHKGFFLIQTQV